MTERIPAHVEATAIMRRIEAEGGFATVLRKGDPDRGTLLLYLTERGEFRGILEREMGPDFTYRWMFKPAAEGQGSDSLRDLTARRERFDPDLWLIELDIADPERFIAETTASG
ncbi:MAG: DUF1491 family protein [Sphingomonas sp.]|nr:DUF1491 family protein [Sphingomonas sp.]